MEAKSTKYTFRGMNQDVSEGKHPLEFFYEANNIRFLTTSETITGGLSFEKGNKLQATLPNITITPGTSTITLSNGTSLKYRNGNEIDKQITSGTLQTISSNQIIIGHSTTRNTIIFFSTDDNNMDCVWEMDMSTYKIKLLYLRNLLFSKNAPIQAVYNYENERIQKVYWVDGINQIRFLNTKHSKLNENNEELINIDSNTINLVGNFDISQPTITDMLSGGTHTSGVIQYAYNLYRLNSSQTKLSPLSALTALTKGRGQGGGEVNEIVGATPIVEIHNIDPEYTHIKVYAIKYTSYNQIPSVSLIKDQEIPNSKSLTIFDDGNILNELSLEQFLFLGSDPIIPAHIETKDNIMFSANIKDQSFDVKLDTRAFSFRKNLPSYVYANIRSSYGRAAGDPLKIDPINYVIPPKHDAVNLNYATQKYQSDQNTLGGEGKYLKYEIVQDNTIVNPEDKQFFKDNEVYRLGIQFYNKLGQKSLPKWIADYRMPEGNLEGNYNTLKVTLKPEFYIWLNTSSNFKDDNDVPVGFKLLRANRTQNDKTVITQGVLNGMMSNYRADDKTDNPFTEQGRQRADDGIKMPSLLRTYGKHHTQMEGMRHNLKLDDVNSKDDMREVHKASSSQNWMAETFQYNVLMQMFSPDIFFGNVSVYDGLQLRVKGAYKSAETKFWGRSILVDTKDIKIEAKVLNGLTPHEDILYTNTQETRITGNLNGLADLGIFGPSSRDGDSEMDQYQFYRNFTGQYYKSSGKQYEVYGKPELSERGANKNNYNGDPKLQYFNSLKPLMVDGGDGRGENSPAITSVNSYGAKNLTFALGTDDINYNVRLRKKLEDLWKESGIAESDVILLGEFVKSDIQVYLGGIYGGNTYENKKRTSYLEIGSYKDIIATDTTSNVKIDSPGDTFVSKFKFGKILKTDTEVISPSSVQITELVETYIESSIDLKNRNDISLSGWDTRFQPTDTEYHKYNRVYSQQPTVVLEQDLDYNFRKINNFDTRIMASKPKVPGENIDSWSDLLVNEIQDLNGKYGPINSLVSFRDELYAFQDNAFAFISINPRVQTQGSDGIAVELGTGGVLHDYKYISTKSGCINKWGVSITSNAIYFLDGLNKAMFRFTGQGVEGLSGARGLHKYFINNLNIDDLLIDNPILSKGVSMGYDLINNDVYLTYNNQWTLCFNEKMDQFTGFYSYNAPIYIYTKEKLITINPNNNSQVYETHAGDYNMFYGQNEKSNLIFVANPEADHECTFNNLEYKSVALDTNKVEQRYTWEKIRAYNEFQDTGYRDLDGDRIRKLNRKYRLAIPRNQNSTDRIRNNWAFIELTSNNTNKLFYLNQDIVLHYRANYIMIR